MLVTSLLRTRCDHLERPVANSRPSYRGVMLPGDALSVLSRESPNPTMCVEREAFNRKTRYAAKRAKLGVWRDPCRAAAPTAHRFKPQGSSALSDQIILSQVALASNRTQVLVGQRRGWLDPAGTADHASTPPLAISKPKVADLPESGLSVKIQAGGHAQHSDPPGRVRP